MRLKKSMYEAFIGREKIRIASTEEISIKDYSEIEKEFTKIKRQIEHLKLGWISQISKAREETNLFVIKEPLEIICKIEAPTNLNDSINKIASYEEFIETVNVQIEKVSNDIIQLEHYQKEFTHGCIRRGELVLNSLKKNLCHYPKLMFMGKK